MITIRALLNLTLSRVLFALGVLGVIGVIAATASPWIVLRSSP